AGCFRNGAAAADAVWSRRREAGRGTGVSRHLLRGPIPAGAVRDGRPRGLVEAHVAGALAGLGACLAARRYPARHQRGGVCRVRGGGVVLLFSGATPMIDERMRLLREIVPLPLLEASHLLGSAAGMALLLLAQSVQRRLDAAWHVTLVLLIVGAVASLAKGFD